jgi:RWD domain
MDVLEEEILAVDAIFPASIARDTTDPRRLTLLPAQESSAAIPSVQLSFPEDYPDSPPTILSSTNIPFDTVTSLISTHWTPGADLLYTLTDALRTALPPAQNATHPSQPFPSVPSPPHELEPSAVLPSPAFAISDPIVDRKSTFVGRALEVHSRREVSDALVWLKTWDKKVARATHNILAWRVVENGVLMQGFDRGGLG